MLKIPKPKIKKKDKEDEEKKEEEKIEKELEEEIKKEEETESKPREESDLTTKLMERINEIENRLPRIDVSIDGLKRELDDIKSRLQKMDDTLKDVMVLYEVVSSQINPFVSSSGIVDVGELKRRVDNLEKDLKLIINIDLDKIIDEILYEEVM